MRKKLLVHALASFGLMAACGTASASASPPVTIKLEPYLGSALAMHAEVNGHPGLFLFDTGGGVTIIGPDVAKAIGCTPWGRITGFRMTGERLDFQRCDNLVFNVAGIPMKASEAGVFDIMGLVPKDAPHLDGSLGLDLFAGRSITLDASGRTLTIESAESLQARVRHAREVPIRLVRDAEGVALTVDVAVPTPKGTAWMELDSGNAGGAYIIAKYLAPMFGLDPGKSGPQPVRFDVAGGIPVEGKALAMDLIKDGNLGAPFFKQWALTVDLASGRAWLSHAAPGNAP
ncbi:aspartyl protease family protein [Dyella agri]|uniref:Retropepsin-like domain-containing protein n=1 Tax=Dyella agri TaxID=1926869 RepID=A0ABW8KF71_9GAMM